MSFIKKRDIIKFFNWRVILVWMPFIISGIACGLTGAYIGIPTLLVGAVLSVLSGFATWEVLRLEEISQDRRMISDMISTTQPALCDECPFKLMHGSHYHFIESSEKK